jgi:hypothetical protein
MKLIPFILLLIGVLVFFIPPGLALQTGTDTTISNLTPPADMSAALEKITDEISDEFNVIREKNRISAEELAKTGITGPDATAVLDTKVDAITYSYSSFAISPDNVVTAAAPSRYNHLVGTDLGYQPETQFANELRVPIISNLFHLVEGFYGISVSYPIFSENVYVGYTDITIRPEEFFRMVVAPFTEQTGYEVFIIQLDGLTIYETNEIETGINILTDPLYNSTEMHNVARNVIENPDGTIQYTFWNQFWDRQVLREAVWTTLAIDEQEWRVGVVRNVDDIHSPLSNSGNDTLPPDNLNKSIAEMTTFVQEAAAYARDVGQETACETFNNISGPYVTSDLYIFAYDMNGTTLALPHQKGLLGKNRIGLTDVNGFPTMRALIDAAKRGGGHMYFVYPNQANDFMNQLKIFRIEPVDSEWFVCSGIFLPWVTAELSQSEINTLILRVKNAVSHAEKVGKKQAIMDFNDLSKPFANGGEYIFAYGYDGTTLALPHQQDIIGQNRMNFTDIYGSRVTEQEIQMAMNGGGFIYVVYNNPDTENNELKLCYVLPAGDDWLVGSGIYTGTGLSA